MIEAFGLSAFFFTDEVIEEEPIAEETVEEASTNLFYETLSGKGKLCSLI